MMNRPAPAHILMVYPPLAGPTAAPLPVCWLEGQLQARKLAPAVYDANLAFHTHYLFETKTLQGFLSRIDARQKAGAYRGADSATKRVLEDLVTNRLQWEARIAADIAFARRLLNYEPRLELAQGLRLTLQRDDRFQR